MAKFKERREVELPTHETVFFSQHPNISNQIIAVEEYSFIKIDEEEQKIKFRARNSEVRTIINYQEISAEEVKTQYQN